MPRCFARGRRTWPGRCRRPCVRGDGREGDTPGDIRRAVEIALREWPNKSQQEIAEQIGCGQGTVAKVKADIIPRNIIPPTRTDSMGRTRPTTYATRTTRTATSATFNPVLDGGATVNTPGAGPGAHVSNSARGPFQAWALDCDCAQRAGTGGRGRDIRPDILPDIRRTGDRPGHDARGLPEHP